jgi:hypothetical protein
MRWAGNVAYMREKRNACIVLVGNQEGKQSLRKARPRLENNIKMDFREIERGDMDSEKELVEGSYELGNEPSGFIKY